MPRTSYRIWTKEEEEILRKAVSEADVPHIAKQLGRGARSIYHKQARLGLHATYYENHLPQKPSQTYTMTDVQKAWLASAIDGEGCISFHRQKNRRSLWVSLSVINTSQDYCQFCRDITGVGKIYERKRTTEESRPAFTWSVVTKADIESTLAQVCPYLIIKKTKADEAIRFCQLRTIEELRRFTYHSSGPFP